MKSIRELYEEVLAERVEPDRRELLVLHQLQGKVICSGCSTVYEGPDWTQEDPAHMHSVRVWRYTPRGGSDNHPEERRWLSVSLVCQVCDHGGEYHFPGDPLREAWEKTGCEGVP